MTRAKELLETAADQLDDFADKLVDEARALGAANEEEDLESWDLDQIARVARSFAHYLRGDPSRLTRRIETHSRSRSGERSRGSSGSPTIPMETCHDHV